MSDLQRSLGAYASLAHLASYQSLARSLSLKRNQRAIAHLSGQYKSAARGRGMEFEDVRLYQPGDDIRSIDWRVTARTGETHTKQFREEREQPVLIVVDQRHSLFFGSQQAMKSVLACDLAAYIAWASLAKGDKVGGLVFNENEHFSTKPSSQRKTVLRFLQSCVDANQQLGQAALSKEVNWTQLLQELKRQARPGTQLYLISDFYGLNSQHSADLYQLAKRCELTAFMVFDPLEQALPKRGQLPVFSSQGRWLIHAKKQQQAWQHSFEARQNELKQAFTEIGASFLPISTAEQPLDFLQRYLGAR